jgi:hypothetical protein
MPRASPRSVRTSMASNVLTLDNGQELKLPRSYRDRLPLFR